ncbi:MAG: DUF1549 domain-containing protein [Armatimonadetes bacterium]|nr:DUF1549 domain-containing protein [Armatimonadota bacterium]
MDFHGATTWAARALFALAPTALVFAASGGPQSKQSPSSGADPAKVLALLKAHCASCHGSAAPSGGLVLDSLEGLLKGGASGKAVLPGNSAKSLVVQRVLGQGGKPRMPMGFAPMKAQDVAALRAWIDAGAKTSGAKRKHWAYIAPVRPQLPNVRDTKWPKNAIDRFVLARLEKEGLRPSPEASRENLCRRLSLDLTGLPPTLAQLDAFLADRRPDAYERLVDTLLASPHFGEKMARAWLDLGRYADTNGYEKDLPRSMWPWRDWLIQAFNKNLPYDQFVIQQLAGDLLPHPTQDQLVATGFLRNSMLNDEGGIDPEEFRVVAVMDRLDAVATSFLGSTMACAQCHDHKYDPFPQRDYYGLYAFLNQTADNGRDISPTIRVADPGSRAKLSDLEERLARAETDLLTRTPTALTKMPEWEEQHRAGWKVLKPREWTARATLTELPDHSLLASGADPIEDRYQVRYDLPGGSLFGLKIEAIPDPSLPEGSSGRNFNGNFVLRRVVANLRHADGSTSPIIFDRAQADFTQGGHDPMSVLADGDLPGWAIAGFLPEQRVHHELQLKVRGSAAAKAGDTLELTLNHQSRHANHNLGRFRVAVTSDPDLAEAAPLPAPAASALAKAAGSRTTDELAAIKTYYLSIAPELAEAAARVKELKAHKEGLEAQLPTTMILREVEQPRPNALLKRGDFRTPGSTVLPHTPSALGGWATRPDRLGLAQWLASKSNPLTARVEVNRLWEGCFGRGLVVTMEDFGSQGDPPTHPELLDWLATEFMARGWDRKALLRLIVTSATYRQSAASSKALVSRDPANALLARGPRFRLDAEGIRDIALTASGRLNPTIGGPSVMPPQPPGVWENSFTFYDTKDRWVDETGPNRYRRGMYTYWRRTAPYPMALTFDLKQRDTCVAKRVRTNTPLQALNTLNDPVFIECAGTLGRQMEEAAWDPFLLRGKTVGRNLDVGLAAGFRRCTGRQPQKRDLAALRQLFDKAFAKYQAAPDEARRFLEACRTPASALGHAETAAWTVVGNVLLNLDETLVKN